MGIRLVLSTLHPIFLRRMQLAVYCDVPLLPIIPRLRRISIWRTASACSSVTKCAVAAALALIDGNVKLYASVGDHLSVYWTAM
ncbi:hypothetical protein SUGI_1084060 [Cryptomeria japonica]|nr:hypothetical protein SUGI_1084060 [Cryptomeria japonica]